MQIHSKLTRTKGFVSTYDEALRFRDMITQEAERRARILTFWRHHGLTAAKEAFKVSKPTLYRWQGRLDEAEGNLEALNQGSRAPRKKRQREIPSAVQNLILKERSMERLGKEKLAKLIADDGIGTYSPSTLGRMLSDLKKRGMLKNPNKFSLSGRTGRMIEKNQGNSGRNCAARATQEAW